MAWDEVQGGNGSFEEREFLSAKIGVNFEGTYVDMGPVTQGQYGVYRVVSVDLTDGRKIAVRASKILLERLEAAGLSRGDGVKVVIESATSKSTGRTYALPRVYVDRRGGQAAAAAPSAPATPAPTQAAETSPFDDEPPF